MASTMSIGQVRILLMSCQMLLIQKRCLKGLRRLGNWLEFRIEDLRSWIGNRLIAHTRIRQPGKRDTILRFSQ